MAVLRATTPVTQQASERAPTAPSGHLRRSASSEALASPARLKGATVGARAGGPCTERAALSPVAPAGCELVPQTKQGTRRVLWCLIPDRLCRVGTRDTASRARGHETAGDTPRMVRSS